MVNRYYSDESSFYFIFLGSKITADSDCSHEIKRCLLLGQNLPFKIQVLRMVKVTSLLKLEHMEKAYNHSLSDETWNRG